jgi:cystathionine gamma-synthase/cystathionine gamma-lyase/cystathionine beta-lyase
VDAQAPETWAPAARPETRVFLCETISNPLMRVPPLDELARFARERGIVTLVDNTFASPVNFRPLEHGLDLAFHSASKYLNGHSDIVAGCLVGNRARIGAARKALNLFGGILDPHAGYLLARGIKTLALRMRACEANALALATFLAGHPGVRQVNYPGLETHPDHAHARRLLDGFGGMLSFRHAGGPEQAARLLGKLNVAYPATSLGGVESLVTLPCQTSHAGLPPAAREAMGITDDLVRVSCGIETTEDLVEDFRSALDAR